MQNAVFLTHNGDMCRLLTGCINVWGNHLGLFLNCQASLPSFHHTSSLCTSYLFILFSASIPSPLAQVSTLLLSHRLMIRALLCLSPVFSLATPPVRLLLSFTYRNSAPSISVPNKTELTWCIQRQ